MSVLLFFIMSLIPLSISNFIMQQNDRKKILMESLKSVAEADTKIVIKFCVFVDVEDLRITPEEQAIFNSITCPLVTLRTGGVFETMNKSVVLPTYIFFVLNSVEEVREKLDYVSNLEFFTTRIPCFFILNFDVSDGDVKRFMKMVWKEYSLLFSGVFVYKPKVQLSTYQPFKKLVVNLTSLEEFKHYFINHEYANLNGKVFHLAVFNNPPRNVKKGSKWSGEDPRFWIDLIHSLNASWKLIQTKNFSYEDAMKEVGSGDADFCPYRYFPVGDYPNVDFMRPFSIDYLVGVVPESEKIPQYLNILNALPPKFWIFTSVSFIGLVFVIVMVGRTLNRRNRQVTLYIFGICLNQSVKRLASYQTIQIFLINLWQFSCLIISATFQASLLETLMIPKYEKQIDNIQELVQSNLTTYVLSDMAKLVETSIPNLTNQLVPVSDQSMSEILMDYQGKSALILPNQHANMLIHKFRRLRNSHIMKQKLVPGFSTYFFKKKSPYTGIFEEMIARHLQYGITSFTSDRWGNDRRRKTPSGNLSYKHLRTFFSVFLTGILVSFVVFILEKVVYSVSKRCSNS